MTLAEFLLARIAEDEAPILEMRAEYTDVFDGDGFRPWQSDWGNVEVCQTGPRALAEIEAKRRIVAYVGASVEVSKSIGTEAATSLLGHLARPYADHPDYQQEWTSAS
jgi:hypothetical protein